MTAWGKLSRDSFGQLTGEHPLVDHMLDVAACFVALTECHGVRRALEKTAGRALSQIDLQRLAALAFLHDLGKANSGFQAKRWAHTTQKLPPGWPQPAGHTNEALCIFGDEKLLANLPAEEMDRWGPACFGLLRASISHHGRPVEDSNRIDLWRPVVGNGQEFYDPNATLREIGSAMKKWFGPAFEEATPLPDSSHFAHLFAGLVQLADWLGSDAREGFFPYSRPGERRDEWVWARAREAVQKIGFNTNPWRQKLPRLLDFSQVFQSPGNQQIKPRPIQAKMADADLGHLLILESETGSGKTEAALWRFAQLFQKGEVDALYFALPTRVAATQLYERTRQFAANMWSGTQQDPLLVVRALAGYESADGNTVEAKLADFKVLWADHPDEQKAHTRWAAESSKRYLAAPLAVGTIDQALLGGLQVRHAHMRHSLLTRSLLVVDEVHASDAYMSTLLAHLLKAHLNAGGHALLLSATLGSSARHRYQRLLEPTNPMPTLAQALALPYPSLTDGPDVRALHDSGRSKQVHWQVKDCIDSPDLIATLAIEAAKQGAKVLVIRNTVPSAVAAFRAIERLAQQSNLQDTLFNLNGIATVHHSRYSREDRPKLDAAVEQQIGKKRDRHGQARIVVGTQTLEQSLDIDADLLITDLCPMDVLLQRVGRLHRHERAPDERPEKYRQAQAVVLVPAGHNLESCLKKSRHGLGRFHNGGGIYMDLRILEATRRLISGADSHLIPQDNRELVERATHPEVLQALAQELGAEWLEHGQEVDGETHAEKVQANLSVLPFSQHFAETDDNGYQLDTLRFAGKEQQINSRLGAADYLLNFNPPQPGPFFQSVALLPMRHHMWPKGELPDTQPVVKATATDGSFTFTLGATAYRYSRFGLERITDNTSGANP